MQKGGGWVQIACKNCVRTKWKAPKGLVPGRGELQKGRGGEHAESFPWKLEVLAIMKGRLRKFPPFKKRGGGEEGVAKMYTLACRVCAKSF